MVRYLNYGLKIGLKKAVYGPKCLVFKWSAKSMDFTIWIPDTHSVWYSVVRYSDGYCTSKVWLSNSYWGQQPIIKDIFVICFAGLHPKYDYPTFIGGILIITRDLFRKVDGLSNHYWGWGLEDDEFYARLHEANVGIERPVNVTSGRKDTFKHYHPARLRPRDMSRCYNQVKPFTCSIFV